MTMIDVHVEVVKSIRIVTVEINKVRFFGLFSMLENFEKMKLDTNLDTFFWVFYL